MQIKQGWRGRVFEDFTVGDIYPHALGRTITACSGDSPVPACHAWINLTSPGCSRIVA